jgi:hypothetical protein
MSGLLENTAVVYLLHYDLFLKIIDAWEHMKQVYYSYEKWWIHMINWENLNKANVMVPKENKQG